MCYNCISFFCKVKLVVVLFLVGLVQFSKAQSYDLLIKGGTVIDAKNKIKESQAIAIEEKYDDRNQNETNNLIELENKLKKIFISFEYISAPEVVIYENLQVNKFNSKFGRFFSKNKFKTF